MMRWTSWSAASIVLLLAASAGAHVASGVCALTAMRQDSVAPASIQFPFDMLDGTEAIPVTVDHDAGSIVADFTQLGVLTFHNGFSSNSEIDTMEFIGGPVTGTIDAGGNVLLPGVRAINCTQGNCPLGAPCPCVPGNLCSNDLKRVCVPGTSLPDLVCEGGGVCQGVCSNDRGQSCAGDLDCAPDGFCGQGVAMRFGADLTSGVGSYGDEARVGTPIDFMTGDVTILDVVQTPPETFAIGDTGISFLKIDCTFDPIPEQAELPAPPAWTVAKGKVKLGKGGPTAADDKLVMKGTFEPFAGEADYAAEDLVFSFEDGGSPILSLRVPAGSMTANKKGTKFTLKDKTGTVVEPNPPLPSGSAAKHTVKIKRKKDGSHLVKVASKGLVLDGLNVPELTTRLVLGTQSPSSTDAVTANAKGNKLKF